MAVVLGVDPRLSGAIALLRDDELVAVADMPIEPACRAGATRRRVAAAHLRDLIQQIASVHHARIDLVVIEGTASRSAECLRGAIQALDLPTEYVSPRAWRAAVCAGAHTSCSRMLATQRWPSRARWFTRARDHGRADAALIAAYGAARFGWRRRPPASSH